MPLQIAIAYNKACEKELIKKGFTKQEVYIKHFFAEGNSEECEKRGDKDFFSMETKPFQFVTTSYWGAGAD